MEVKSVFDVLLMIQPTTLNKVVILNYEHSEFIICDSLKDKFPQWKRVEKEVIGDQEYIMVVSDFVYYVVSTEKSRKYFFL